MGHPRFFHSGSLTFRKIRERMGRQIRRNGRIFSPREHTHRFQPSSDATKKEGITVQVSVSMNVEWLIDDFAIRSFRDRGDEDYISARMSFRAALATPSLWASLQAIEKYLKCILLLNRIQCNRRTHDLSRLLHAINTSSKIALDLTRVTSDFINHLNEFGSFRYLEISNVSFGGNLTALDRAAWELRKFCGLDHGPKELELQQGIIPPKFRLAGGYLEAILDDPKNPAREPLVWQNAFFGKKHRRQVRIRPWVKAENAPLYLNPQILDEIIKYVYLPPLLIGGYRQHGKNKLCI
jgi:hypothetical protein